MAIIHWIGIDDHADKWTIAHLRGDEDKPVREFELVPDESGYRKLIGYLKKLGDEVRVGYEAGPCGYTLYRRLNKSGISCLVAAPALTPIKPGEKVKTNRRDARKIARCLRDKSLTAITVPDADQESLRDLVRARASVQRDVGRVKKQITHLLLRYGFRYGSGTAWTTRHWSWLKGIALAGAHSRFVLDEMLNELTHRLEQLARFDAEIEKAATDVKYVKYVGALCTLRGINTLSAMTVLSELGDLRRFPTAPQLMAAIGLVPREHSTGDHVRRFSITKAGNAHVRHIVVEAAWHYRRRPVIGRTVGRRRKGQPQNIVAIAQKCDKRLNSRFNRLTNRGKNSTIAAVAVARELVGFIWAIGQHS